jgi:hypothetical protein
MAKSDPGFSDNPKPQDDDLEDRELIDDDLDEEA